MDALDLARWTRFAAKGGIGKCTALQDCVAQGGEDLMFLKDDEVVVLLQLAEEDQYLGYCEGVVGRFHGSAVRFHSKLKKAVFAKRQSTTGSSSLRSVSLSPHPSPSGDSSPASSSVLKSALTPPPSSLPLPDSLLSDERRIGNHVSSARSSTSVSISNAAQSHTEQIHQRIPSNSSSLSHYSVSAHSRSQKSAPAPVPVRVSSHTRKSSTASTHSTYSSGSRPPSRNRPRSDSTAGSGSEDTYMQPVPLAPPLPVAQVTPTLTDTSSAHSSFVSSPTPAFLPSSLHGTGPAVQSPVSAFQSRMYSGSENSALHTDAIEGWPRSGSESASLHYKRAREREHEWEKIREQRDWTDHQLDLVQEEARQGIPVPGLSETSFQSVSMYSNEGGGENPADETFDDSGKVDRLHAALSVATVDRGLLNEDEGDEDDHRSDLVSSPDDDFDGGFAIGMTLLREDDDEDSDDDDTRIERVNDNPVMRHIAKENELGDASTTRSPRVRALRLMNRGSVSTVATDSDSEGAEDDTLIPTPVQMRNVSGQAAESQSFPSANMITTSDFPSTADTPSSSTLVTNGSSTGNSRKLTPAPTDEESWGSDGDIYDDYRYSRHSSHYSGSPGPHSSRHASRGSTKSGRSRVSERPPLPDEESWRKAIAASDYADESVVLQWKSPGSEHASVGKLDAVVDPKPAGNQVSTSSPALSVHEVEVTPAEDDRLESTLQDKSGATSPSHLSGVPAASTPGASSFTMSLTSPLTRAFRKSDDSKYSGGTGLIDDEADDEEWEKRKERSVSSRSLRSPTSDDQQRRSRSRSGSPAFASSMRDKIEDERRAKSPNVDVSGIVKAIVPPGLSVNTSQAKEESGIIILNDGYTSTRSHSSRSASPEDGAYLRVDTPQSNPGSLPPSPLNPGFPPSPSVLNFPPTPPLNIVKSQSPIPSPSTPRQPIMPPAIPFVGVPPPGRPPAHMQYAQRQRTFPIQQQMVMSRGPPLDSLSGVLRLAGQQRANTIHAQTQTDLLSATGPVPISFVVPGMPPPQQASFPKPYPTFQPSPYGRNTPEAQGAMKSPVLDSQFVSSPNQGRGVHETPAYTAQPTLRRVTTPTPPIEVVLEGNVPSTSNPMLSHGTNSAPVPKPSDRVMATSDPAAASPTPGTPLPRANFFPKVGQIRPRSRSFSGFRSDITEKVNLSMNKRSQEEGSQPFNSSLQNSKSVAPPSPRLQPKLVPSNTVSGSPRGKPGQPSRPSHGPSPLSLPPTTNNIPPSTPKSPLPPQPSVHGSVITRIATDSTKSPDNVETRPKRRTLRKTTSHHSFQGSPQPSTSSSQARHTGRQAASLRGFKEDHAPLKPPSPLRPSGPRQSHESDHTSSSFNRSDKTSSPAHSNGSPSSSPLIRSGSLRSKMSVSALKSKGSSRNQRDGVSETTGITVFQASTDEETVQVKDLEFELVRPVLPHASDHRGEENADSRENLSIRTMDLRQDTASMRHETLSPVSPAADQRLLSSGNSFTDSSSRKAKAVDMNTSVQAHRDRELKWISTINGVESAQARKSKKVKKLLIEGVPSSVRYLVWAHISNSGSKKMPNVYTQLSKRRPVMAQEIERDVDQSFPAHAHLRDPNGPLVSVLFAFIAMVPDLRYHRGLAIIAGHLLLQSPEEDAFWTFLAMMDGYLRPYFMDMSPQMKVDVALFVKAVEAADPQIALRVFVELNVRPQELCGVWFSTVFAGTLPLDHLHRVWDLFLYEGVPFLFRVGLALLLIFRRQLLEASKNTASYVAYLLRPPPEALPADPEEFIALVLTVKVKDDDIRKSRVKLEAAVKQQLRQPRASVSQPNHPHLQAGRSRAG